jgi:hypothetical protein
VRVILTGIDVEPTHHMLYDVLDASEPRDFAVSDLAYSEAKLE